MATAQDRWINKVLGGTRYVISEKLGEGGMGSVYLAEDRQLGTWVVIKTPHSSMVRDPEFSARFKLEVQSLIALSHPQIVRVLDVGQYGEFPFVVLQYLSGSSLESLLYPSTELIAQPQSLTQVCAWLSEIASALDFIHLQGYIHRDIKPANILFDENQHAYLTDFGIAKVLATVEGSPETKLTATGMILGTAEYMAPELLQGKPVDRRVDQYALAVTVFEALSGTRPYDGNTPAALAFAQVQQPIPQVHQRVPGLPAEVSNVLSRALALSPTERFRSCEEFAAALSAAGSTADSSKRVGQTERSSSVTTRKRAASVALATSVASKSAEDTDRSRQRSTKKANRGSTLLRVSSGSWARAPILIGSIALILCVLLGYAVFSRPVQTSVQSNQTAATEEKRLDSGDRPAVTRVSPVVDPPAKGSSVSPAINSPSLNPQPPFPPATIADTGLESLAPVETSREKPTPETDGEVRRFDGHVGPVYAVTFSADGKRVLSGGADKSVRSWDLESGQLIRQFSTSSGNAYIGEVWAVALAPDGQRVFAGYKNADSVTKNTLVWDSKTGRELRGFCTEPSGSDVWAFSSDGRRVLSASGMVRDPAGKSFGLGHLVRLWDLNSGQKIREFKGHTENITSVALSFNGLRALSSSLDKSVRLWDVESGQQIRSFDGHNEEVWHLAFSNDGRRVLSASLSTVLVWDIESGEIIAKFQANPTMPWYGRICLGFSPDGRHALSASRSDFSLLLWDVDAGRLIHRFKGHTATIHGVAFSPDGGHALSSSGEMRIENGKLVAGADNTVRLWQLPEGVASGLGTPVGMTDASASKLKVPLAKSFKNSVGMDFVLVPPESASQELKTDQFYLATTEVTQAQYSLVTGSNPSFHATAGAGKKAITKVSTGSFPVENITWSDAAAFCNRLSAKEDLVPCYSFQGLAATFTNNSGYRLPTIAERAAVEMQYRDIGKTWEKYTWYRTNSNKQPHRVASRSPDSFGLYDVFGNVWEFVSTPGQFTGLMFDSTETELKPGATYTNGLDYRGKDLGFRVARNADEAWTKSQTAPKKVAAKKGQATVSTDLSGLGLRTEIYAGTDLLQPKLLTRVDRQLDWLWIHEPPGPGLPVDNYSVRWTGWLKAPRPGTYKLIVVSDDGVRLWLDDQLLKNDWQGHLPTRHELSVELKARPHKLRVEYFQGDLSALCSLRWSGGLIPEMPIPPEALFQDELVARKTTVPMPTVPPVECGLLAEHFTGTTLQQISATRNDSQIDNLWGFDTPRQDFSIRWTGWLKPPKPGRYSLRLISDDGARVWIDDRLVIDRWVGQETTRVAADVDLLSDHTIKVEYFNIAGTCGICSLRWLVPGSTQETVVPATALFRAAPRPVTK